MIVYGLFHNTLSMHYLETRFVGLKKTTKYLSQDIWCPGRYSNSASPKYKSRQNFSSKPLKLYRCRYIFNSKSNYIPCFHKWLLNKEQFSIKLLFHLIGFSVEKSIGFLSVIINIFSDSWKFAADQRLRNNGLQRYRYINLLGSNWLRVK
jgi:hypothetical protein